MPVPTETDLRRTGVTDVAILYGIVTTENEYSGAVPAKLKEIFSSEESIVEVTISLTAKREGNYILRQLDFKASETTVTGVTVANKVYVGGDDPTWTDNTFSRLVLLLSRMKTTNRIIYSVWTDLAFQLVAVLGILTGSIQGAKHVGNAIGPSYSQYYVFVAFFLLGSNLWTYVNRGLLRLRGKYFPVVGFKRDSFEKFSRKKLPYDEVDVFRVKLPVLKQMPTPREFFVDGSRCVRAISQILHPILRGDR